MDYKFFLQGIANIIIRPAKYWEIVYNDNKPVSFLRNNILLPLTILIMITSFAGSLIYANAELEVSYSVLTGIKSLIVLLITVYATSLIHREITYPLDLGRDFSISFKIISYSLIPFLICQIFSSLFESLVFLNILGLYGVYIFWTGSDRFLNPAQHKKMPMVIATTITFLAIYILTDIVLGMVIDRIYNHYFS
jgi:hypothetical protein